jgi:hypothetical protein
MDNFGFGSSLNKREAERNRLRQLQKQKSEEEARRVSEAISRTTALLAEKAAIRKEAEVRALIDEGRDRGAGDGGVSFEVVCTASGSGKLSVDSDRVILSSKVLEELSKDPAIRYPLMFELFNHETKKRTHCGVLEFSAPDDVIVLPQKVQRCLGIEGMSGTQIRIRYKQLEKCTYLRCSVPASSVAIFPDIRTFLESSLRLNHVTLTVGDRLIVGGSIPMIVDSLQPDFACCLIDTDVELDMSVIEEDSLRGTLKWTLSETAIFNAASHSRILDLSSIRKISPQHKPCLVIRSGRLSDPTADMFVSIPPQLEANVGCFDFISPIVEGSAPREIRISLEDLMRLRTGISEWPAFLTVGISNLNESVSVEAVIDHKNPVTESEPQMNGSVCDNCDQRVAQSSIDLHRLHCIARIRKCTTCKKPIRVTELDLHKHCGECGVVYSNEQAHLQQYHTLMKCLCGKEVTRATREDHRATVCPNRLVGCRFCGILTPIGGIARMDARDRMMGFISEHEALCGNRTDRCSVCGRLERLKDMELHRLAFHSE